MGEYSSVIIWSLVLVVIFGWAWRAGHLMRLRKYVSETKEELRKCSWPTKQELKGSTAVVMVSIALLGVFTFVINEVIQKIITLIMA
ncbi:MAG: preprotein translocase subunit SecE [Limisphaerales bacterium]|jgi:preprotein translocase subunit SecE|tara:strand:+ start:212 stop:472 length:261 start_codon:yes stop_codon:yes gene_type:complete